MSGDKSSFLTNVFHNPLFFGLFSSILIGVTGVVLLSLVFYYTPLSEAYLHTAGTLLYLTGAFVGGFLTARKAGRKGLLYGAEAGFLYFLFFIIIGLCLDAAALSFLAAFLKGVYTLLAASAGGIVGIAFSE